MLQLGDVDEAESEARRAVALLADAPATLPQALATLARVLMARGAIDEALAHATRANDIFDERKTIEQAQVLVRLSLAEALHGADRIGEAKSAIVRAQAELSEFARKIPDGEVRRSFLARVPENARTRGLYAEWLGRAG